VAAAGWVTTGADTVVIGPRRPPDAAGQGGSADQLEPPHINVRRPSSFRRVSWPVNSPT